MDLQSGHVFLLQQPLVGTFQQTLQGLYASNTSAPGAAARPVQFLDSSQFYAGAVAGLAYQTLAPPPVTSPATSGWAPLLQCMWWMSGPPPSRVSERTQQQARSSHVLQELAQPTVTGCANSGVSAAARSLRPRPILSQCTAL